MKAHAIDQIDTKGNRRIVILRTAAGYRVDEFERVNGDGTWHYRWYWETGLSRHELNHLLASIW
ncbi:MAG: hypothetical protein CMJ77_16190 [Planctomycetaceae bacterium]|nr:hypothetical protein [Planctomycetaceae bacterium]